MDAGDEPEGPDTDREHTAPERFGKGVSYAGPDDAEDSSDMEHDTADYEPSLGAPEGWNHSQIGWSIGGRDDYEAASAE